MASGTQSSFDDLDPIAVQQALEPWPCVAPVDREPWSHTVRNEWSSQGESAWMRLSKFSLYNRLFLSELLALFARRPTSSLTHGADLRLLACVTPDRMARILAMSSEAVRDSFCASGPTRMLVRASRQLRYCVSCLEAGFHSPIFQWDFIGRCPIHRSRLILGCSTCRSDIPYSIGNELAASPLQCQACQARWAALLHGPTGKCQPLPARAIRIFGRWARYIRHTVECANSPSPFRIAHVSAMNRVFEVPPPLPAEASVSRAGISFNRDFDFSESIRHRVEEQASTAAWTSFGKQFKDAQDLVTTAIMAKTRQVHRLRTEIGLSSNFRVRIYPGDSMSARSAGAHGWSASWLGYTQTFSTIDLPPTPAPGLMSWFAYLPVRSRCYRTGQWHALVMRWLEQDLFLSYAAWMRIAQFMHAHGRYIMHGAICPPIDFARRHSAPDVSTFRQSSLNN